MEWNGIIEQTDGPKSIILFCLSTSLNFTLLYNNDHFLDFISDDTQKTQTHQIETSFTK